MVFEVTLSSANLVSSSVSNSSGQIASIVKRVIENGAKIGLFRDLRLVDGRADIDQGLFEFF